MNFRHLIPVLLIALLISQVPITSKGFQSNRIKNQPTSTTDATATDQFELISSTSNTPIDGRGSLSLTFENTGEDVSNAKILVESPNESIRFGSSQNASQTIGSWSAGERKTVTFDLLVEEFAEDRNYPFQAFISYTVSNGSKQRAGPYTFNIRPTDTIQLERFKVTAISSNVQSGNTGTVSLTLENTGRDVNDAIISLRSQNEQLRLGKTQNTSQFVSEWSSGEDVTVSYRVTASNDTVGGSYPFSISISYLENDSKSKTNTKTIGVIPTPEQSFSLTNVNSTLRIDEEGSVTGTITNEGPRPASDVVLVLQSSETGLQPASKRYPIGNLAKDESRRFRFDVDTTNATSSGPHEFVFRVIHHGGTGNRLISDPISVPIRIAQPREPFAVNTTSMTFSVDSSGILRVNVTNNAGQRFTNITTQLLVSDPLSSDDDSTYLGELSPGESETAAFQLTVGGEAIPKRHPVAIAISYETPSGDIRTAGPYAVSIDVRHETGIGSSILSVVVVLAVLVLGVIWWFRQR